MNGKSVGVSDNTIIGTGWVSGGGGGVSAIIITLNKEKAC